MVDGLRPNKIDLCKDWTNLDVIGLKFKN